MSRHLFAIVLVALALGPTAHTQAPANRNASAPQGAPLPKELEDPNCLGLNKEPAHATLMPYKSLGEALAANRHASTYARSLNGEWKFDYVPRPEQRPTTFFEPGFDSSSWKSIPVPSNWQVLGYGTPYYRNAGYTIKKDWPRVTSEPPKEYTAYEERNPVGSYLRTFDVPADWKGRTIFLTFDGVDSAFFLWVNGKQVGYSVNSRNAAEFDITRYVRPGNNALAVQVYRYSSGTYLEDQDMWRLSGIFRNVTLWSAPALHVRDFSIRTDLDAQYRDATLDLTAHVKNYRDTAAPRGTLRVDVYDAAGAKAAGGVGIVPALAPHAETVVHVQVPVKAPAKWTAETPTLYTTVLTLGAGGPTPELLSARTGFRKIEIKGRQFLVNGVPIKLKGANRHEHWPEVGHAITEAQMIRDLEVLKQGNANHVRTSHYSDDPRWYELCDLYGIWLVAEANVECHGYYDVLDREPAFRAAIVDRNVANVQSFKNHPSIIMWSLGNENGGGSNLVAAMEAIRQIDPRPVHYEPFGIGAKNPADVDSRMYTHPTEVEKIALDASLTKPFYMCEYAHAMFNSMGSIGEYNDLFDKYPSLMGGAIWEWQDQGLWNRRDPKRTFLAYGGGFGDVPNDHYFIHKGVVFSDRTPKPHYPEMKRMYQWVRFDMEDEARARIRVTNKYQFISLAGFTASWALLEDGREIAHGPFEMPALAPGESRVVAVPVPTANRRPGAEYFLNVSAALSHDERWAKVGTELASAQFPLPTTVVTGGTRPAFAPLTVTRDDRQVRVAGNGFTVGFDKATGTISVLERGGVNVLATSGGPRIHLWRAPHRNDDMWAYRQWEKYGVTALDFHVVSLDATQTAPGEVRVSAVVKAQGKEGFDLTHSATYTISGDGSIAVDNQVTTGGPRIPLARIGVRMLLDKRLDRFDFFGRGPMENYADRKRGFDVGVYGSSVAEQMTPYAKPMEAGNHEDVRWAAVTGQGVPGLIVRSDGALLQAAALPYTDEQMMPFEYRVDLPPSTLTAFVVSSKTLGVGSNGCGPRPLDKYIVWSSDVASFSYKLRVLAPGEGVVKTH
ncbi:MAG: glycoside hydrolase family 2 TIM barrel-domain containing protein [Bacteroidales bacterium]